MDSGSFFSQILRFLILKPLPDSKMLALSILKEIADHKSKAVVNSVENIAEKRRKSWLQASSPFPQAFNSLPYDKFLDCLDWFQIGK